jgi:hypothetical protein
LRDAIASRDEIGAPDDPSPRFVESRRSGTAPAVSPPGRSTMDVFYLGLAVGFFAISWALVVACERL